MKFNKVFLLTEEQKAKEFFLTPAGYKNEWYNLNCRHFGSSIKSESLTKAFSLNSHGPNQWYAEALIEEIKKYGKKAEAKSGDVYYIYSVSVPIQHEGIEMGTGKNIVFLYVESEETVRLYMQDMPTENDLPLSTLENEAKKHIAKFKAIGKIKKEDENKEYPVGTILYTSWGYDQTNVDFYVVIQSNKSTLWINKISGKRTTSMGPDASNVKAGSVDASDMKFKSTTIQTRAKNPKIDGRYTLRKDNGKEHYSSWGH